MTTIAMCDVSLVVEVNGQGSPLLLIHGFEKWVVLGHSFGGLVALEYALRHLQSLSHLPQESISA